MSFLLNPKVPLRELLGPVAKDWDETAREPNPDWATKLLAKLK